LGYRYYGEREPVPPELSKAALDAIHTALRLNPRSGRAFIAQVPFVSKSNEDELRLYEKAVALDPDEAVVHQLYSYALQNVGRMRDAVDEAQRAVDLNPLSPSVRQGYIGALTYAGRLDQAREKIAEAERIWPNSPVIVAEDFWFNFRYGDANRAEMLLLKTQAFTERGLMLARVFMKTRTEPSPDNNAAAVAAFVANEQTPRFANQALLTFGALKQVDKTFDLLNNREFLPYLEVSWLFRPELQPVRRDPRFMAVVARLGLIKYWRESGHWADFCMWEPLDYDCKAEARKYPN
jgi:tetratricopeptide (TPR) repeat protein